MSNHFNSSITIIGAGASGLFTSILLAKKGYKVTIFEKNIKAGRKIVASGNGRCNITNKDLSYRNFHSTNSDFFKYAISNMPYKKIEKIFFDMGLLFNKDDSNRVYPMSLQSSCVRDILVNEALKCGVIFQYDSFVTKVIYKNNLFEISIKDKKYLSKYLIVSTGSPAMEKLGSCSSGYDIAKSFNHKIIKPFASLVQVKSDDKLIYSLSGVKIKANVSLYINNKFINKVYGDILFTKYGLSGNSIIDLSRDISKNIGKKIYVDMNILPNIDKNILKDILIKRKTLLKDKDTIYLLQSIINTKIIKFIYTKLNIKQNSIKDISLKDIDNMIALIYSLKVNIIDTNGIQNAEVVAGGVDVKDINRYTMQSNLQKNLYFCGEILDVDGSCGGYNFHWAWSSGYVLTNSFK